MQIVQRKFIGEGEERKAPNRVAGEILSFFTRNNFVVTDTGETVTYALLTLPPKSSLCFPLSASINSLPYILYQKKNSLPYMLLIHEDWSSVFLFSLGVVGLVQNGKRGREGESSLMISCHHCCCK